MDEEEEETDVEESSTEEEEDGSQSKDDREWLPEDEEEDRSRSDEAREANLPPRKKMKKYEYGVDEPSNQRGKQESRGGEGEGDVVAVQAMEEQQVNIRIPVARLYCHACVLPLKPPTFKVSLLIQNLNLYLTV